MKETGIIMSGNHPRLILDLIKTMTRRTYGLEEINKDPDKWQLVAVFQDGLARFYNAETEEDITLKCPYGGVVDRLWVRETFCQVCYKNDDVEDVCYKEDLEAEGHIDCLGLKYSPSIHMPRWASRITLEITEEKVARTQDLTLAEAIAEGYSSIEEANRVFLKLVHLPESSNGWNWVIFYKLILGH